MDRVTMFNGSAHLRCLDNMARHGPLCRWSCGYGLWRTSWERGGRRRTRLFQQEKPYKVKSARCNVLAGMMYRAARSVVFADCRWDEGLRTVLESMSFPVYLHIGALKIHPHFLFEALAYGVGFRLYVELRKSRGDFLDTPRRWWVGGGGTTGAFVGA